MINFTGPRGGLQYVKGYKQGSNLYQLSGGHAGHPWGLEISKIISLLPRDCDYSLEYPLDWDYISRYTTYRLRIVTLTSNAVCQDALFLGIIIETKTAEQRKGFFFNQAIFSYSRYKHASALINEPLSGGS